MTTQSEELASLLASVHDVVIGWDWDANEDGPDLASSYASKIERAGCTQVLRHIYLHYTASMGTSLLLHLHFVWKRMHYHDWLRVLAEPPEIQAHEVQYFRGFFCEYLAIDFEVAVKDAGLSANLTAQLLSKERPKSRGPVWGHVEDVFANEGLDPWALWRRLAAEGAPMLISSEGLSRGHVES